MQAGACPALEERARMNAASWRPVSARLRPFRVRRLAGMQLLGAGAAFVASSLGRELAARIDDVTRCCRAEVLRGVRLSLARRVSASDPERPAVRKVSADTGMFLPGTFNALK